MVILFFSLDLYCHILTLFYFYVSVFACFHVYNFAYLLLHLAMHHDVKNSISSDEIKSISSTFLIDYLKIPYFPSTSMEYFISKEKYWNMLEQPIRMR